MNDFQNDCSDYAASPTNAVVKPPPPPADDLRTLLHGTLVSTLARTDFRKRLLDCELATDHAAPAHGEAAFTLLCTHILNSLTEGPEIDIASALIRFSDDPLCQLAALQTVARSLGEAWCTDSTDFASLTAAVSRLQSALHKSSSAFPAQSVSHHCPSVHFVLPVGETHRFATALVEEHFRIRGWRTELHFSNHHHDLKQVLVTERPNLVCLSWSDTRLKPSVNELLEILSEHRHKDTLLIAGGPATLEKIDWLFKRGVDNVFSDTYLALECAEMHIAKITKRIGGQ
ncbi:hypothetical protein JM93_02646 [Roseibium hamelinense]|uniref:Methanogenic corrinoid protein MtbC1 n=1 Tax=Roseibium hamelinense TaxID=150831 RepID=A0A562SXC8_9HYPH|nr:hypothetical protein [Roseibium hamelinense]MTI44867.1 hypothetical protein [Roseibium hamelinense]TWI85939.1 hypothetical protein JM93_02646 [Roseibium hamelinense]